MTASGFWDSVLEPGEVLLWAGRPKPRLHWRNWRLYAPVPLAILGLGAAFVFARVTVGPDPALWLFVFAGLLVLVPLRATRQQLTTFAATRYALTDRRAIYFRVQNNETRVKAYPKKTIGRTKLIHTLPQSVNFISYSDDSKSEFGFAYVENSAELVEKLASFS